MRSARVTPSIEFEDQRGRVIFDPVDCADVGVIERREQARLALEAGKAVIVAGDGRRQDLDGHITLKTRIASAIHTAHPAGADQRLQFVDADPLPDDRIVVSHTPEIVTPV